jgi:hypothetical protein
LDDEKAGVDRPWDDDVLTVLVRYWNISCNLDNFFCLSWSDPFAPVALIGDFGGSSRLKVVAIGEVGDFDSSSRQSIKV